MTNIYAFYLENTDYTSDGFLLNTEDELRSMLLQKRPETLVIKLAGDPGATLVDYGFEMYIISTSNNKSVLGALPVENLEELDHVID